MSLLPTCSSKSLTKYLATRTTKSFSIQAGLYNMLCALLRSRHPPHHRSVNLWNNSQRIKRAFVTTGANGSMLAEK